jgi:GNAT superfamily N-acetyltransferase
VLRSRRTAFAEAIPADASELAALHMSVAEHLTRQYGQGPWSNRLSDKSVLSAMRQCRVLVARQGSKIVGTVRLGTKKPWAIDTSYFSNSNKPLYLLAMAVLPEMQRQGLGRRCLEEAERLARAWRADAIRLDAYDADAGAGGFYARCGFTERGRLAYRGVPLIYYEILLT